MPSPRRDGHPAHVRAAGPAAAGRAACRHGRRRRRRGRPVRDPGGDRVLPRAPAPRRRRGRAGGAAAGGGGGDAARAPGPRRGPAGRGPRGRAPGRAALPRVPGGAVASAEVGAAKPDPAIFAHALAVAGADPEEAWHAGDSAEADVGGARAAGLVPVFVARHGEPAPPGVAVVPALDGLLSLVE